MDYLQSRQYCRNMRLPKHRPTMLLIAAASLFPGVALAAFWDDKKSYTIEITALDAPAELQKQLKNIQKLLEDTPAGTSTDPAYLHYRYDQNKAYLEKALHAQGYYEAKVEGEFEEESSIARLRVIPGTRYTFGQVSLSTADTLKRTNPPIHFPDAAALNTKPATPAIATTVFADEESIKKAMSANNCLFSYDVTHQAVQDTLKKQIAIAFDVNAGPNADFGAISFDGQQSIAPDYLARVVPIKEGECFHREKINDATIALQKTGLLASVEPEVAGTPGADGRVPVVFHVKERAQRSIKAGASYSTDVGPGLTAGWEHRNLFSRGEKADVTLSVTTIQRTLETTFTKPFFLRDDQKLRLAAKLDNQDTDAYTSESASVEAGLERDFKKGLTAGTGLKYTVSRVNDENSIDRVALLSAPTFISKDKRNDVLDATKGWLLRLDSQPYLDTLDTNTVFYKNRLTGNIYKTFDVALKPVIALRASLGSITGASTQTIPATERFYAGGASSIRGYAYQKASPLDSKGDPIGGRSVLETSAELRLRIKQDYGLVTFIDAGNAYDTILPKPGSDLRYGAGLGLRYYTSFGPLRADIAMPINRRRIDDAYQLYFSIGQAF